MIRNKICNIGIIYNVILLVYLFCFMGVLGVTGHVPKSMGLGLIGGACGNGVIAMLAISLAFQGDVASYIKAHRYNKANAKPCSLCTHLVKRHMPSVIPCIPIVSPDPNIISVHNGTNGAKNQHTCTNIFLHTFTLFPKIWIRVYRLFRRSQPKGNDTLNSTLISDSLPPCWLMEVSFLVPCVACGNDTSSGKLLPSPGILIIAPLGT